ncbi:igLON family member 5-like [Hyalella azteca]|uniref:IgLON family member 5-like n=1 Tax=Hyalella azteca TaxID=294128 RepID=A0A979FIC1_HYAAZ|nr:igLON family member 5-like [Hyalella azteca]
MCQINTDPMINQMGYLQIVVVVGEGEVLNMVKVSRLDMGAFLCVASNGIQPSVSKRTQLKVQFPPMLWIPNQLEAAHVGGKITLECNTEAFPRSINYWTNHRGEMIADAGPKYDTLTREESYKTYMRLTIHNLTREDFTTYRCIAKNSLGETDGSIKLYEMNPSTPQKPSSVTNLPSYEEYPSTEIGSEGIKPEIEGGSSGFAGESDSNSNRDRDSLTAGGQHRIRPVDSYKHKQRARGSFMKGLGDSSPPYDLTFPFDAAPQPPAAASAVATGVIASVLMFFFFR